MEAFLSAILSNPLRDVGVIFAFCAGYAFLIWLWGLLDHIISHENVLEREEGRTNMVRGVAWLTVVFVLWEVVRVVANWL